MHSTSHSLPIAPIAFGLCRRLLKLRRLRPEPRVFCWVWSGRGTRLRSVSSGWFTWIGLDWFGLVWIGLDWLGLFGLDGWIGLVWIGLDWFGLVWIGLDWFGLVWIGLDWFGLVWIGLDWFGLVWIGLDWFGLVWIGLDWFGLVWIGLDWFGLVWIGLDWFGLVWNGLDWFGLVWIGLDWFGLVWIGLEWFGLVWIGLDWFGLVWIGLDCCVWDCWRLLVSHHWVGGSLTWQQLPAANNTPSSLKSTCAKCLSCVVHDRTRMCKLALATGNRPSLVGWNSIQASSFRISPFCRGSQSADKASVLIMEKTRLR